MKLKARLFTKQRAGQVAGFVCGERRFEKAMATWITGPLVFESMKHFGNKVWLYYTPGDEVVGFGSLGVGEIGPKDGPKIPVAIIPALGIHSKYQGKPDGQTEDRYSHQILRDLIRRARKLNRSVLCLYVYPKNARAIALYSKFGFVLSGRMGNGYDQMLLRL